MIKANTDIIKTTRLNKGLNQQDVADQCNISRITYIKIENNQYIPGLEIALNICYLLNLDLNKIWAVSDFNN